MDPLTLVIILCVVVVLAVLLTRGSVDTNLLLTFILAAIFVWLVWVVSTGRV